MSLSLQKKTIMITGASQGIGRQLALAFAKRGARLVLTARSENNLRQTAELIRENGGNCFFQVSDLTDSGSLAQLVESVQTAGESVDVLINNAADVTSKPFMESSLDEITHLINTNVTGMLHLTRLLMPAMVARKSGMVINIGSLGGYKPNPAQTVYSITKAAVNASTIALSKELRASGIRFLNVAFPSIGLPPAPKPGQLPIAKVIDVLEHAILTGREGELFFSSLSHWLMRLYRCFPSLVNLR